MGGWDSEIKVKIASRHQLIYIYGKVICGLDSLWDEYTAHCVGK